MLLLLLYLIIFGFSGQDGEQSGGLSLYVSEKCAQIVNTLTGKNWTEQMLRSIAKFFEHPIRKFAHFSEYTCMGMLVYVLWSPWIKRGAGLYLLTVAWVFFSAVIDEAHQFFVPGRYCSFADVLLDSAGGIFGLLLCILTVKLNEKRKHKKKRIASK